MGVGERARVAAAPYYNALSGSRASRGRSLEVVGRRRTKVPFSPGGRRVPGPPRRPLRRCFMARARGGAAGGGMAAVEGYGAWSTFIASDFFFVFC